MDGIPIPVPVSTPVYKKFKENNPEIKKGLKEHIPKCKGLNNASQQPQMPVKNRSDKAFYNHKCMQPNPYRIFWDLEMLTEKLTSEKKTKLTHTERIQKHRPCGYCYVVVRMDSSLNYEPSQEVLQKFKEAKHKLLEANEWEASIEEDHPEKKKIQKEYKEALSALNRKGYDSHPLMKVMSKFTADKLNCIPENIGKYKAMDQNISKEDYEHAQKVWQTFEMKSFGEYHDLYLETDVLLLADVFMNYTIMCLQDDGLDPSHYVSAPGMFNDSLYKSSGAELKLMMDMDEYLMVEKGIRGSMTMASHRYAKANNPKCPDYDSSKPTTWILYEDMNALYSGVMTQYMPTEIIGKVGPEEVPDIQTIAPDAEIGYMPEVDLEVLAHLHNFFADYPLALEKQIVPENWLSLYNERLVHDKAVGGGKYTTAIHEIWVKVTKIHGALKFQQSPWMKEYIEENIRKRKIAKANGDEFGKLRAEKNPNDYIKTVAIKMFPSEEAYNLRLENYRSRYADKDLCASLEDLYELYYHIAKEENRERSDEEIEQMLRAMSI
ncbi:uncharacterized protein LOC110442433 [Rhizophagus clarus]|uniref:Uncharacterized protein LOC110442433 n=1 Tax=Rhizophagus clarus TaxID=94130 RepID=A0A8H3LT59_9GLOM|nr:uncharacterized protein LOC110442433 [Rhizophagus clarus]